MNRRWITLMFMLVLMGVPALADGLIAVSTETFSALIDPDGAVILGDVDAVYEVRPGTLYTAGKPGDYHLYDSDGNCLTETAFSMIEDVGGVLLFRADGLCGAMDDEGRVIVPAEWTQLVPNGEGGFLALNGDPLDDQPDAVYYLIPGGEATDTGCLTANGLRAFSEGRMPFAGSDGKWGCLDSRGRQIMPTTWRHIGDYSDGLALASDENGRGVIDVDGNVIIPMRYAWMARQGVIAALDEAGRLDVYGPDGALLFSVDGPVRDAGIVGEYVFARMDSGTRLYDENGSCLCEAGSSARFYPGVDGQAILADGAWGEACWQLINPDGSIVSARFQRLVPLCSGRYAFMTLPGVQYQGDDITGTRTSWDYGRLRWGMIDGSGQEILPAEYDEIRAAGEERFLLFRDEDIILADMDGAPVTTLFTAGPR